MVMSSAVQRPPEETDLKIALYDDKLSTAPTRLSTTWEKFADLIVNYPEESPCTLAEGPSRCKGKDCPHKAFSSIKDNPMAWSPTDIEGMRLDSNVRAVTLLSLDFDHLTLEVAQQAFTKLLPYEHVKHTTHSHRDDDICFRAVLALTRPVLANEYHRFLATAVAYLDITVVAKNGKQQPDKTCSNRSRLYFRPSSPKGAPRAAGLVRGKVLDVDEVLAWGATQPQTLSAFDGDATVLPEERAWDLQSEVVEDAIDLVQRFFPDNQRNELCLALAGMLRRNGATREDARYIVREICLQGGSTDPDARAKTVDHTYDRDDDSAMTGFTRTAEILGEDTAKEFGDFLTDARNEAYLRNTPTFGSTTAGATTAGAQTSVAAAPVDLVLLRKEVSSLASKRMRSLERDDKVTGILLRRVLNGEALAQPGGMGDPETVRTGDDNGIGREAALRAVTGLLAFTLPENTPWEAVAEILRPSLSITAAEPGQDWLTTAQKFYKRSLTTRSVKEAERKNEMVVYQDRVRQNALAVIKADDVPGGGGGGLPPDGPTWQDLLTKGTNGAFAQTPYNIWVMLRNHPDFCGFVKWNEISKQVVITGGVLVGASKFGMEAVVTRAQDHFASAHSINIGNRKDIAHRIMTVARENAFDPLKDYLNALVWDGKPRITNWLKTYCGANEESNEYLERVARCWAISLVARGLKPGCKVDNVLVLQGDGGLGKSTVFSIFGGEWFCDTAISLGDKDSRMMAGQYWLCEMAEIVAFKKTGHDTLKSFFSSSVDRFRPPYAAAFEESPRRCVWVGTTNDSDFLVDETGNRKYWPVVCRYVEGAMEMLKEDRDQLLAEAVVAFKAGEKWHFDYKDIALTEIETERHMVETPTTSLVTSWWYGLTKSERPRSMTTAEVAMLAFDCNPSQLMNDRGLLKSIGMTMAKMGFKRRRDTSGSRTWRLYPTEELLNAERVEVKRGNLFVIPGGKKDDK
jgi:hypothetical protein